MNPRTSLAVFLVLLAASAASVLGVVPQGPNFTVFFTGDQDGEVASCGCPKEDYGGATRKAAFLDTLRSSGWSFLTVDLGDLVPFDSLSAQNRLKAETMARAMSTMGYDALTLGDHDLAAGPEFADQLVDWLGQPVVATNYELPGDRSVPTKLVEIRGKKVGLVGFLDPDLVPGMDWLHIKPWAGEKRVVGKLRRDSDLLVAMVHAANLDRVSELVKLYPKIDLVLAAHEGRMAGPITRHGDTYLAGTTARGRYLGRVDIAFDAKGKVDVMDSAALPVIEQWGRRAAVDTLLFAYYADIKKLVETEDYQQEAVASLREPDVEFVGNETCVTCHAGPGAQWATTKHSHAHETLAREDKDHDPECQACHTVGFGMRTGFSTPELTPDRWNVGCESCHGGGAHHVEDPKQPYGAITVDTCMHCHTSDRSPDFDFAVYRSRIVHTNMTGADTTGGGGQ